MNLKWYYYRWKQFDHPFEVFYRLKQYLWNRFVDPFFYSRFDNKSQAQLIINESSVKYKRQMSFIQRNELLNFYFYNIKIDLNCAIKWRFDYKNNIESPIEPFYKIKKNSFNIVGELKIALEPSRFTFLPSYTYYYLSLDKIKQQTTYSHIKHIVDWNRENPFLQSFNWSDGIEVGIRAINLTLSILITRDLNRDLFETHKALFYELIAKHDFYLRNHLSFYSSANNHLIAELSGLLVINCAFKIKNSNSLKKYYKLLLKYTPQQFFADGFSKEQSTHYFKDVLSLYSIVVAMLKRIENSIDMSELLNYLDKSKAFLESLRIEDGIYFDMGDNDNSVIIDDLFSNTFNEYESVRSDLAIIRGRHFNSFDFRNHLLWGNMPLNNGIDKQEDFNLKNSIKYYDNSKYLIYHKNGTHLLIDYSNLGYKYLGAHGHSDLMSFQLFIKGTPVFIDSGTYQYHSKFIRERNYFRSICAHNTLSIDGNNHAVITSNMMWNKIAKPDKVTYNKVNDGFNISGEFKFPRGKKHTREYRFNENENELEITDRVFSKDGLSQFEIYFQINSELEIKHTNTPNHFNIFSNKGTELAELKIIASDIIVNLISEQQEPFIGWTSKEYDVLEKGRTLRIKGAFKEKKQITSKIKLKNEY
jgi:hypothetical protein